MPPERFHVLLLRHGQTDSNAGGVLQGHLPTPLNALGHAQARLLAARIAAHEPRVGAVVTSDLRRAAETAAYVAAACGMEPVADAAWRERGFGAYEGRAVGEAEVWRVAAGEVDPPGAESMSTFDARVLGAMRGLPARFAGRGAVAVVTHGGPIRAVLRALGGARLSPAPGDAPDRPAAPIANCSVTHFVLEKQGNSEVWAVRSRGDAAHLRGAVSEADHG